MRILLTGSSGFIGKNLVEMFKTDGYDVLSPDVCDLDLRDQNAVKTYLSNNPVHAIIHSATTLRQGTGYPVDVCENNLRMFFNLEQYRQPGTKLINFGSGSEYSRPYWHEKMEETFFGEHIPADSHSYSKYIISRYIETCNDPTLICLRIFGIYGKYEDHRYKFISNAIAKNLLKMPIIINQNVSYDYIYINDFYQIVKYFLEHKPLYPAYNATPCTPIDLVSIAEIINTISDYKSDIHVLNDGIGVHYSGNNQRLVNELKNYQIMEHADAIRDLFQYYQSRIPELDKEALEKDEFLNYAKSLRKNYFKSTDKA